MPRSAHVPVRRAEARLVTGPVAHLAAGLADWAVLLARFWWARARGREPWM